MAGRTGWIACVALVCFACGGEGTGGDPGPTDAGPDRLPMIFDFGFRDDRPNDLGPADPGAEPGSGDAGDDALPGDEGGEVPADVPPDAAPDANGEVPGDADSDVDLGTGDGTDPGAVDLGPGDPGVADVPPDVPLPDVPHLCDVDEDCADEFPVLGLCERAYCDPQEFACRKGPALAGTPCEDGNPCSTGDQCSSVGTCLAGDNACDCGSDADCKAHDDADLCNGILVCSAGTPRKCVVKPGSVVTCPASKDVCVENVCKPDQGYCSQQARNEGWACDDKDACTTAESCRSGKCRGTAIACDDSNPCTQDSCAPDTGCVHVPISGPPCDDGDACTAASSCQAGACVAAGALDCDDDNECTLDGCDSSSGCTHVDHTQSCEDGNACTTGDACSEGTCIAGPARDCDDQNACTTDGCEPGQGCTHVNNTDPCDDGNPCTTGDRCQGGACTGTPGPTREGVPGDPACSNGQDEDCDGLTDAADPDCGAAITGFSPVEAPSGVPVPVEILGSGLADAVEVRFGDAVATVTTREPGRLVALAPLHDPGRVTITVQTASTLTAPGTFTFTGTASPLEYGTIQSPAALDPLPEGGTTPMVYGQVYHTGVTGQGKDPSAVQAQLCRGPRGTLPWTALGWECLPAAYNAAQLVNLNNFEYMTALTPPLGEWGLFFRFSLDGIQWLYADRDGNDLNQGKTNGCTVDQALALDVVGTPAAGDVILNELMWMGNNTDSLDEWFELRNLTDKPFDVTAWVLTNASTGGADLALGAGTHTVNRGILSARGLLVVSHFSGAATAIAATPDIVAADLQLSNSLPQTYALKSGTVILDTAKVVADTAHCGENGKQDGAGTDLSMERNAGVADGTLAASWHTADCRRGWGGAVDNGNNYGSPRLPNCDVAR